MKFKNTTWTKGIALALTSAMFLTGCGKEAVVSEEENAIVVETATVSTGDLALEGTFIGTISPEETVSVFPMASGMVKETFFEVGDVVNAGDVLFKIDDDVANIQVEQAKLMLESTQLSAESTLTTQQDVQNLQLEQSKISAQSAYEQAQIAYVNAKDAYKHYDDKIDSAKDGKNAAESAFQAASSELSTKKQLLKDAESAYAVAKNNSDNNPGDTTLADLKDQAEAEKNACETAVELAQTKYDAAQMAYSSATSAYETVKSNRDTVRNSYYQAQSSYKAAERGMEMVEENEELTNGDVYEDTEARLENGIAQSNLSVKSAELSLSYCTVTAPVSGVIDSKNVDENGMCSAGMASYTIVNNNTMTATFYVSEKIKDTLALGQELSLERNGAAYTASITEIGSSIDPTAGLFKVKACVNATGDILPSGVTVRITTDTYSASNVVVVPYSAIYNDIDGSYVYVANGDRAEKRYVTTGIFNDDSIVVADGLQVGEKIITSWSPQLTSGVLLTSKEAVQAKQAEQEADAEKTE